MTGQSKNKCTKATSYSCGRSCINVEKECLIESGLDDGSTKSAFNTLKEAVQSAGGFSPDDDLELELDGGDLELELDGDDLELELDGDDSDLEAFKARFEAEQAERDELTAQLDLELLESLDDDYDNPVETREILDEKNAYTPKAREVDVKDGIDFSEELEVLEGTGTIEYTAKVGDNTVLVQAASKENLLTGDADNLNQELYVYVNKTFDKRKANIQGGQDAKRMVVDSINRGMAQVLDNVAEGAFIHLSAYDTDGGAAQREKLFKSYGFGGNENTASADMRAYKKDGKITPYITVEVDS